MTPVTGCRLFCVRRASRLIAILVAVALGQLLCSRARAVGFEIDIPSMVTSEQVFEQDIEDPVWQFEPRTGRTLISIPATLAPGDEPIEVSNTAMRLLGGRFVGWQLVDPAADELESDDDDSARANDPAAQVEAVFPEDAPTLTLRFELHPDYSVRWRLLPIPGAEVERSENLLYALRLDRDLLREQDPNFQGRPDPSQRDRRRSLPDRNRRTDRQQTPEQRRAEAERMRAERDRQQEERATYQELQRSVADLPTDFVLPRPARVWAIFEVRSDPQDYAIDVDGYERWAVRPRELEAARRLAQENLGGGQRGGGSRSAATDGDEPLSPDAISDLQTLSTLVGDGHPFSARLAAQAIASSRALERTVLGDATYRLTESVINNGDAQARTIIAAELAQLSTPTSTSQKLVKHLLGSAGAALDTETKMLALRGLLNTDLDDTASLDGMLLTTNQYLEDPAGPDPGAILAALVEKVNEFPSALPTVAERVSLDRLRGERLDLAIRATLELARRSPLAGRWLDERLLGAPDRSVARRTVELIGEAPGADGDWAAQLLGLNDSAGSRASRSSRSSRASEAEDAKIPITSAEHHLFEWLSSSDEKIRRAAWSGMERFNLEAAPAEGGGRQQSSSRRGRGRRNAGPDLDARREDPLRQLYEAFVQAALSHAPTPPESVELLARQTEPEYAGEALADIAARGDEDVAKRAAASLIGKEYPLGDKMILMNVDDRHAFAGAVYQQVKGSVPAVAGLVRERSESADVAVWFATEVGIEGPPELNRWLVEGLGDDQQYLFELIKSSSDEALALGAAAALASSVAGDDQAAAAQVVARFRASKARRAAELEEVWEKAQHELLLQKIAAAAGQYRMAVTVLNQEVFDPAARPPENDQSRRGGRDRDRNNDDGDSDVSSDLLGILGDPIDVGTVQLSSDGRSVSFEGMSIALAVPDDFLAIRIDRPTELKSIPSDGIKALPLEEAQQAIHLMPQGDGTWRGQFRLGRFIGEVKLTPVGG